MHDFLEFFTLKTYIPLHSMSMGMFGTRNPKTQSQLAIHEKETFTVFVSMDTHVDYSS